MTRETMAVLVMINNFFHDLSVGILFSNILLTLTLLRLLRKHRIEDRPFLNEFIRLSSRITWVALAFIIAGGVIRTVTYREFEWAEAAGRGQVAALILKHIILVGCTLAGVGLQFQVLRKYHKAAHAPMPYAESKASDETA